jgi:hypothetical protein
VSAQTVDAKASDITLDDLRHKALKIRADVTDEIQTQVIDRRNQIVIGAVVGVVVVVSLAYYFGTRAGARRIAGESSPS